MPEVLVAAQLASEEDADNLARLESEDAPSSTDEVSTPAKSKIIEAYDSAAFDAIPQHRGNLESLREKLKDCTFLQKFGDVGIELGEAILARREDPNKRGPDLQEQWKARKAAKEQEKQVSAEQPVVKKEVAQEDKPEKSEPQQVAAAESVPIEVLETPNEDISLRTAKTVIPQLRQELDEIRITNTELPQLPVAVERQEVLEEVYVKAIDPTELPQPQEIIETAPRQSQQVLLPMELTRPEHRQEAIPVPVIQESLVTTPPELTVVDSYPEPTELPALGAEEEPTPPPENFELHSEILDNTPFIFAEDSQVEYTKEVLGLDLEPTFIYTGELPPLVNDQDLDPLETLDTPEANQPEIYVASETETTTVSPLEHEEFTPAEPEATETILFTQELLMLFAEDVQEPDSIVERAKAPDETPLVTETEFTADTLLQSAEETPELESILETISIRPIQEQTEKQIIQKKEVVSIVQELKELLAVQAIEATNENAELELTPEIVDGIVRLLQAMDIKEPQKVIRDFAKKHQLEELFTLLENLDLDSATLIDFQQYLLRTLQTALDDSSKTKSTNILGRLALLVSQAA